LTRIIVWIILIGIFLLAGEGFNLLRLAIMQKLADPQSSIWLQASIGTVLMFGGIGFLGGLIYYRDQKRGRVKKPDWMQKDR
jgi:hypothetical protein